MIELLLQAERALSVGLLDRAEKLYRQVAKADPRNSIAVVGLARVTLDRGDDVGALKLAKRALAIDPENDAAQRMVARLEEVLEYREISVIPEEAEAQAAAEAAAAAAKSEAAAAAAQATTKTDAGEATEADTPAPTEPDEVVEADARPTTETDASAAAAAEAAARAEADAEVRADADKRAAAGDDADAPPAAAEEASEIDPWTGIARPPAIEPSDAAPAKAPPPAAAYRPPAAKTPEVAPPPRRSLLNRLFGRR
jgi:hypothetical protein